MRKFLLAGASLATLASAALSSVAFAAETITYTYDEQGRVVKAERTSGPQSGPTTNAKIEYEYDKADNRTRRKVTPPA